ncbi:hypothetical protein BD779DRAFT_1483684 [Infundibulicybe gibba]|nr:hypothetical protein BD779DRAFT_1483684 [Infundibulicybe gibba]
MTATNSFEQEKRRYSRELAEYTLKQWNAVREAQSRAEKDKSPTDEGKKGPRRSRSPVEDDNALAEATPKPKENKNGHRLCEYIIDTWKRTWMPSREETRHPHSAPQIAPQRSSTV